MRNLTRSNRVLGSLVVVLAAVVVFLLFTTFGGLPAFIAAVTPLSPAMPVVAVTIAALSLLWTAYSTRQGWQRTKKQATIDAWVAWSDASLPCRKTILKHLGNKAMEESQAKALIARESLVGLDGALDDDERAEVGNAIVVILNGLERIAVGVEHGVYDGATLIRLGGTIIEKQFTRFEEYVHATRSHGERTHRQARAYISLEQFVKEIRRKKLDPAGIEAIKQ